MSLRLEIVSQQRQNLGERGAKDFGQSGGTIGRSLESDWVLPDGQRFLSSRHASIDFRSGSYYIIDTSTNGVYINGSDEPVGRGKPQRIFSGDRIRMGDYEVMVEIADIESTREQLADLNHVDPVDRKQRVDAPDPTGHDLVDAFEITGIGIQVMLDEDDSETLSRQSYSENESDWQLELEPDQKPRSQQPNAGKRPVQSTKRTKAKNSVAPAQPAAQARPATPAKQVPPQAQPPKNRAAPQGRRPATKPAPQAREPQRRRRADPQAPVTPSRSTPAGLEAFFAGAGLPNQPLDAAQAQATLHRLGQVVRAMIDGIAENLQLRALQKARLQQSNTTIQPVGNNSLKFSAGIEEALNNLLFRESEQYLNAVDSVRGALGDILTHQQVLMAALQHALADYLSRFDPEVLEDKFANGKRGKLRDAANRLKYWDLYKDLYTVLSQHPAGELPQLFIDELARAYELGNSKAMLAAKEATGTRQVG